MDRIRTAVIGAGRLGGFHARLLADLSDVDLVAVVDPDAGARNGLASLVNAKPLANCSEFSQLGVQAAVVAAPTRLHLPLAAPLLEQGIHLLIEKPIALSGEEADELVEIAGRRDCVLQVGHVERFNPAFEAAASRIVAPRFIEAERRSGFTFRSTDIGVVLDLMIHDLDLALSLAGGEVVRVDACGASMLGGEEDVASARLVTDRGCVIQLTASRVSQTATRKMNIWCSDASASIDFGERTVRWMTVGDDVAAGFFDCHDVPADERAARAAGVFGDLLPTQELAVEEDRNPILEELRDFTAAIRGEQAPRVDGASAAATVHVADQILAAIGDYDFSLRPATPIIRPPHWHVPGGKREAG